MTVFDESWSRFYQLSLDLGSQKIISGPGSSETHREAETPFSWPETSIYVILACLLKGSQGPGPLRVSCFRVSSTPPPPVPIPSFFVRSHFFRSRSLPQPLLLQPIPQLSFPQVRLAGDAKNPPPKVPFLIQTILLIPPSLLPSPLHTRLFQVAHRSQADRPAAASHRVTTFPHETPSYIPSRQHLLLRKPYSTYRGACHLHYGHSTVFIYLSQIT